MKVTNIKVGCVLTTQSGMVYKIMKIVGNKATYKLKSSDGGGEGEHYLSDLYSYARWTSISYGHNNKTCK